VIMQFPKLTVIWSHGVSDTVRLFQRLKQGEAEPVLEEAQACGKKMMSQNGNLVGRSMLMAMPGVLGTNIEQLMRRFGNMQGIFKASKAELAEILGEAGSQAFISFIEEAHSPPHH